MPFISHFKADRNTSRATDRSLEGFLVFIELNFVLYMIFSRHRRQQNQHLPSQHHLRKSITNFRKPLEVGLKLAVTLRHLSTGESYTSLQYQWRVGRTTICKFVPQVCKVILKEFQQEYLVCPIDPEDWKKSEERFRNRWNVPHAVSALDGKHIAIKKPKKSGSEYFNYKGYFSLLFWL